MKILIIVAYFIPEIGSAAHVYYDLAKAFVERSHEVDIITSYPRDFNLIENDRGKSFKLDENMGGISIHRFKYKAARDDIIFRGLEHFLLPLCYFKLYLRLKKKFDVCLMYIPPLPLCYLARLIKRFDGTPSVLNFQDFHPQELMDVGVLKNRALIKLMEYIEHQSYKNADFITVLSEGGIGYICQRGGNPFKIKHIYNGCVISDLNPSQMKMDFKNKEGIEGKFLVSYAGILSPFQGLDIILDAAKSLKEHKDIIFYIVGDGLIKNHLEQRIIQENLNNVRILPFQTRCEYLNIINSSDISLVCLDERMKAPCIPGKLTNLMALNKPLIAIVPHDSETARVMRKSKNGFVVPPGDIKALSETVLLFRNNKSIQAIGKNGEIFLRDKMDLNKNILLYEEIFNMLVN